MTSATIHMGCPKCGSSALQTAFSEQPSLVSTNESPVEYVAVRPQGVWRGSDLSSRARHHAFGYIPSVTCAHLTRLSASELSDMGQSLRDVGQRDGKLVLSNEGWMFERAFFEKTQLFQYLNLECELVVYVRPPVDWMNTAWWQWGAWTGESLGDWVEKMLSTVRWYEAIAPWRDMPGVNKLNVRLLPEDVVGDFCALLDLPALQTNLNNTSLPGSLLRLYQRHPELRPGPHRSEIDFVLARHLQELGGNTPWVLGPDLVEKIIEATKESNRKLLELLDVDSRTQMEGDSRWWNPAAYGGRQAEPPEEQAVEPGATDALAAKALRSVYELDEENRKLRAKLEGSRGA